VKAVTRPRNPRGQGERLRQDLLRAAVDLIAETGSLDNVSLRAVAKRAGVSPTAVYQHFADRDALVEAAVVTCWEDFSAMLAEVVAGEPDPYLRLRKGGDAYVRFALEHPGQYSVMVEQTDDIPGATPAALSAFNDLVTMVADILRARGDDRDPVFVAVQIHTWTHGIVTLAACAPEIPWPGMDELMDSVAEALDLVPPR
jgi:AcrR family transcriptional regulator